MNTLTFGSLVINIEIKVGYHEDRPPIDITFKASDGEIIYSVVASSDDDIIEYIGEYVLKQRGILLGGRYPSLFKAIGSHALKTGRGDLLLEPIFAECGMVKRDNGYILQ